MEIVLNDFSVNGQFTSCDEFTDYILDELSPVLDLLIEKQIPFLKRQDFYSSKITKDMSLNDILMCSGDPAIYAIKSYISDMAYHEPYWDVSPQFQNNVEYKYPAKGQEPNCFTEVIERKGALLSFPSEEYGAEMFECHKNETIISVHNIMEKKSFLAAYLSENMKNVRYVLENYPYELPVIFADIKGKCYAEEALLQNDLSLNDLQYIMKAISRMIEGMRKGEKNDYWDSLRDGLFEFRVHVSSNRIFRLLFFQDSRIVFLNGFIKKTQKTPPAEIEKALKIKRKL